MRFCCCYFFFFIFRRWRSTNSNFKRVCKSKWEKKKKKRKKKNKQEKEIIKRDRYKCGTISFISLRTIFRLFFFPYRLPRWLSFPLSFSLDSNNRSKPENFHLTSPYTTCAVLCVCVCVNFQFHVSTVVLMLLFNFAMDFNNKRNSVWSVIVEEEKKLNCAHMGILFV